MGKKKRRRKAKQGQTFPFISTAHLERERLSRKCIVMFTLCSFKGPKRQWRRRLIRSHGGLQESQDVQYHWTSVRDHFDHHRGVGQSLDRILTTLVTFRCRAVWNFSRPLVNVCFPSPYPPSQPGIPNWKQNPVCMHALELCTRLFQSDTRKHALPQECNYNALLSGSRRFSYFLFFFIKPKSFCSVKIVFYIFYCLNTNKHCQMNVCVALILWCGRKEELNGFTVKLFPQKGAEVAAGFQLTKHTILNYDTLKLWRSIKL